MAASRDKIMTSDPGALGAEETRQSIPNLAVKLCCGDNTAGGALWEDSSAPGLLPPPMFFSLIHFFHSYFKFSIVPLEGSLCEPLSSS